MEGAGRLSGGGRGTGWCAAERSAPAGFGVTVSDTELGPSVVFTGPGQHVVLEHQTSWHFPP